MNPVWQSAAHAPLHTGFATFSDSTPEDAHFLQHDLAGSVAHVRGLARQGLLSNLEEGALVACLQAIAEAPFLLDPALEDVHMNLEAHVTAVLGDVGKKIHTGRSRNDQVATCIALYIRAHGVQAVQQLLAIAAALATQAEAQMDTPWTAKTHGQEAQPATLGFLLLAEAKRFQDAAGSMLGALEANNESPLGCGAVAGSTLPLDPAWTAALLGFKPPTNALLATGARDTSLVALHAVAEAGRVAAAWAEDWFGLFGDGYVTLPDGFVTGSSLMPQKKNPDGLELVRGKANGLVGPAAAVRAITANQSLGYVRDYQAVKPWLVLAFDTLHAVLEQTLSMVEGSTFAGALPKSLGAAATDIAEALVATGMPFRDAYTLVAKASHDLPGALRALPLTPAQLGAAEAAATIDAGRRTTLAGPAAIPQALAALAAHRAQLEGNLAPFAQGHAHAQELLC